MNNEGMKVKSKKDVEIINDRLNALSIDMKANLKCIQEINDFFFPPNLLSEKENEKEAKVAGWFEYVIDMLTTINNVNCKIRDELNILRKELKD